MVSDTAVLGAFPVVRDRQNDYTDDIATKQRWEFVRCHTIGKQFRAAGYLWDWAFFPEGLRTRFESRPSPALVCCRCGTSLESSRSKRSQP
jgi:hypothetical protein